jgi:putative ABC transport system ATP-binding protein
MNRKTVIKIQDIEKGFTIGNRQNRVLKGLTLEVFEGEFLIIFGPSGCGKTTFLNTIMGIERPDSGSIEIFGKDLWKMNADDRADMRKRNIGIIYQKPNWIKSLTVIENVAFSAQLLGYNKAESFIQAKKVIAQVGMSKFENFYTSELSSGEQQKIGLARAIILNPEVILADEPTGNLDTESGEDVLNTLRELAKQGKTVVLVTHNPGHLQYCDRVVAMKDGYFLDVLSKTKDIQSKVENIIKKEDIKNGEDIIQNHRKKPSNTELDYPSETFLQKIKTEFGLIVGFFFRTIALFLLFVLEKISPQKSIELREKISALFYKTGNVAETTKDINSLDLTEIAFKNIFFKRFRTIVTILGVALGTGFVVLLLSLGYGVEKLVVDNIAQAQDLNQVDLFPKVGSQLLLDENLIEKIEDISGVDKVYRIKSFPGRVDYLGSTVDVVVYGVEHGYLENTPIDKTWGEYFSTESKSTDAIINKEYLNLLELDENIIGESLNLSVIQSSPDSELEDSTLLIDVVGVVEDDSSPIVYLQIEDVSEYTAADYSQATVVVNQGVSLDQVRKQIESLGLETFSVMDTINQVQSLFAYLRLGLLIFGIVAFAISFLGMINTLTVSLLERTSEIGLMKVLGVKKNEIRSIFITESMLIAFLGGMLGILFGIIGGYIVSFIVYLLSVSRGVDFIMISHFPVYLVLLVVGCITILGFLTGLYPTNRAVKIPPLDALRYE